MRLSWAGRTVEAMAADVSLRGARLMIPAALLVEDPTEPMAILAREICEALPSRVPVRFHPDLLGPLVERVLQVVRVGVLDTGEPMVELGCRLDFPLHEVDAAAMGVVLAKKGETTDEACARACVEEPRVRDGSEDARLLEEVEASRPFPTGSEVELHTNRVETSGPVIGSAERVDETTVVVRIPDRERLGLPEDDDSVSARFANFCDVYGTRFELRVQGADDVVWSGPVRVQSFESTPQHPEAVLLGFAFVVPRPDAVTTSATA